MSPHGPCSDGTQHGVPIGDGERVVGSTGHRLSGATIARLSAGVKKLRGSMPSSLAHSAGAKVAAIVARVKSWVPRFGGCRARLVSGRHRVLRGAGFQHRSPPFRCSRGPSRLGRGQRGHQRLRRHAAGERDPAAGWAVQPVRQSARSCPAGIWPSSSCVEPTETNHGLRSSSGAARGQRSAGSTIFTISHRVATAVMTA